MKAIALDMPDEVYQKLETLASQDHQSVNSFLTPPFVLFCSSTLFFFFNTLDKVSQIP